MQTQSLALHKRKPQETQALALASSQSWLPLLRPSTLIGWRLRLLRENFTTNVPRINGQTTDRHAVIRNFAVYGKDSVIDRQKY